ncbi:hypothetical protein [Iodobacter fluviatilis]|nr:hypothetical protein [Iodobacter fluviatilis]
MFKCFDGVRPKYTYQNKPCEETGLKTAKIITDKDALIGSADFSGYKREANERAALADLSEQANVMRQIAKECRRSIVRVFDVISTKHRQIGSNKNALVRP